MEVGFITLYQIKRQVEAHPHLDLNVVGMKALSYTGSGLDIVFSAYSLNPKASTLYQFGTNTVPLVNIPIQHSGPLTPGLLDTESECESETVIISISMTISVGTRINIRDRISTKNRVPVRHIIRIRISVRNRIRMRIRISTKKQT